MEISVIIPVNNIDKYLAEAIESVVEQRYSAKEIIVIDSGNTEDSSRVAFAWRSQIRLYHQPPLGISAARNFGVSLAECQYIAFLDADDLWTPDKLLLQKQIFDDHPETDMVFGQVQQFNSPEISRDKVAPLRQDLEQIAGYTAGTLLISKEKFLKAGLFNESLKIGEFIDWYVRAKERFPSILMCSEVIMKRRIHLANTGILLRNERNDFTRVLRAKLAMQRNK
jgi:glycosyltransferase involved in cell wall biosynthesis